jgi:tetratricopeptide (TPR) repeat protein
MTADDVGAEIYQSLQRSEFEAALEKVQLGLSLSQDRPRLQARLYAWKGQALLGLKRHKDAQKAIVSGISLARKAGDTKGAEALRDLHRDIVARIVALSPPVQSHESPLTRALAAFDAGLVDEAIALVRVAIREAEESGEPRDRVLALLALARAPGQEEVAILTAHGIAQESDDFNLVSAVARAAKAADIDLPPHVF